MAYQNEIERLSLTDYLAMEEAAEYRSEFYNGEVYAMSGGTPAHSRITLDSAYAMIDAFGPRGCEVFESGLKIHVESLNAVLYPDASVFCGPLDSDPATPNLIRNPTLILEVLSKGTSRYDHNGKFFKYQMIPSLRTYVLVEQNEPRVYVAHRNENGDWGFSNYFGLDAVIELAPLGVSITMAQIYKRVSF
jgi:Uma2 family endonuclease